MYLLEEVKDPIVSVIIPVYNGKDKIGRAIDSVLNQTFEDFELIIVDDASTDGTIDTVLNYKDERILTVRHSKNRERSASRNDGAKLARGKYLAFLDHDDEWLPYKLEKQVKCLEKSGSEFGVIYSGYYQIIEGNNLNDNTTDNITESPFLCCVKKLEGNLYDELKRGDFILPSTVMIKKNIFDKVGGFDERLAFPEAWELWLRLSKITQFKFIKDPLVNRYIHGNNSISMVNDPFSKDNFFRYLKYLEEKHGDVVGEILLNIWLTNNFKDLDDFICFLKDNKRDKIVIFGASSRGQAILSWLFDQGINVDFFVDNDAKKWGTSVNGIPIENPNILTGDEIVFIASSWAVEIGNQLKKMGVEKYVFLP